MKGDLSEYIPSDKRVKSISYVEFMFSDEHDRYTLVRYDPKSAGVEENILRLERDKNGMNLLTLQYHFETGEAQAYEILGDECERSND